MSVAQQDPAIEIKSAAPAPAPRNRRWAGYWNLLLARMRELQREPEVIFWVFAFPLLLALGLGIAFRSKPVQTVSIAIAARPGAGEVFAMLQRSP